MSGTDWSMNILLTVIFCVFFLTSQLGFAYFFRFNPFDGRQPPVWETAIASLINALFLITATIFQMRIPYLHICLVALLVAEYSLLFETSWDIVLMGALHFVYFRLLVVGAIAAIQAMAMGVSLPELVTVLHNRVVSLFLSMVLFLVLYAAAFRFAPRDKIRVFLLDRRQVRPAYLFTAVLFAYQCLGTDAYYYMLDENRVDIQYLIGCLLFLAVYFIFLARSITASDWTDKLRTQYALEEQMKKQMLHYATYESHSESIRVFRHDYRAVLARIRKQLKRGEREEALRLLEELDHTMQDTISCFQNYSNHPLADAAMLELAGECAGLGCRFEANLPLPVWLNLSELELGMVLGSLSRLAADACAVCGEAVRWVRLGSAEEGDWLTITMEFPAAAAPVAMSEEQADAWKTAHRWLAEVTAAHGGFVMEEQLGNGRAKIHLHLSRQTGEAKICR